MAGFDIDEQSKVECIADDWGVNPNLFDEVSWSLEEISGNDEETSGFRVLFHEDSDLIVLAALGLGLNSYTRDVSLNAFDQPEIEPTIEQILGSRVIDSRSSRAKKWSPLTSILVKNFKAAKEAEIPLGEVTILVGPNGSGKSSVLQAVHWAARAASYVLPKSGKEMIAFERLDYIPSSEPLTTLHNGELKTGLKSEAVEVYFKHSSEGDELVQTTVRIRAARNKGGITAYLEGGSAVTPYKQRFQFITAYIPGLAGLSERETILAQPTLRRQASSGDAGGVLRNILYNLSTDSADDIASGAGEERLNKLNGLIQSVHPNALVDVSFDEREDFHISASIKDIKTGSVRPLETAATGILQVIQIFAYLILFKPKIMLIDEPDAHLHPDKQERLIEALELASAEFETQVVLTTHSPNIVRAASGVSKLVWMRDGEVQTDDADAIRRLLGWGGLDKSILFFVEDEDDKPLRAVLRQWPSLLTQVAVCRCFGLENLPKDKFLTGLLVDGELKIKAVIHRDGDFMTDEEAGRWRGKFDTQGVFPWVTAGSDLEGYFCSAQYLAALFDVTEEVAEEWRCEAANKVGKAKDAFFNKRNETVRAVWPNGGSPDADAMWKDLGGKSPNTVKGKKLHGALKSVVKSADYNEKLLDKYSIPEGVVVAEDLKEILEAALDLVS